MVVASACHTVSPSRSAAPDQPEPNTRARSWEGIPLAFAILDPGANALAAAILLMSFYANGASFLAYAVMAEKRGIATVQRGTKSLYFTTGLAEASETLAVFVLFCLLPQHFALIAYVFAAMTAWTVLTWSACSFSSGVR